MSGTMRTAFALVLTAPFALVLTAPWPGEEESSRAGGSVAEVGARAVIGHICPLTRISCQIATVLIIN